jgi:hypothetical protein
MGILKPNAMKKLFVVFIFLLFVGNAVAQTECEPLSMALKQPNYCQGVILNPYNQKLNKKFIKRINRFEMLNTVYIERGFTSEQLQNIIIGLNKIDLEEVIVECDTLSNLVSILAGLHNTSKITLKEPFVMRPNCLLDISKLSCTSLSLKSSTRIKLPKGFAFPNQLEEIEILSKKPERNYILVDKLAGLKKLSYVYISTNTINELPTGLGAIPGLSTLEIIKATEIDKEDDLMAQKFRMAKEANECKQLVSITYNTAQEMNPEEKQHFGTIFSGYYYIEQKEKPFADEKLTAENIAQPEVYTQLVGFKPIVNSLDVKRKVFTIPTETPTKIEVNSGTIINIPVNAFVDANGNPIDGDVNVTYREIKTPIDMLMSGVPMAYDSGGVTNQFVSAGNFEILAFSDGQPVNLAQGKKIDIDFVSADKNPGYNLYKLDATTKNWEYLNNADEKPTNNRSQPEGTEAPTDTLNLKPTVIKDDEPTVDFEYGFDTTVFEERFANFNYRYMLDENETKGTVTELNKKRNGDFLYATTHTVNTKTGLLRLIIDRTDKVKKDSTFQVKFKLVQKVKKNQKTNYFPELVDFRNYTFYTTEESTRKLFRNQYIKNQPFYDVRIVYENGNDYCTLQLKNNNQIIELTADITQGSDGTRAKYRKLNFARKYKRYARSLNKRIARLNNGLERRKKIAYNNFYFQNKDGQTAATTKIISEVSRSLSITGLGVYNCDAFYKYSTPPSVLTDVIITTADSAKITPVVVYVVDNRINGLLTYSPYSVSLYKRFTKTIVAVDKNDNIYCIDKPATQAITDNVISVKMIDPNQIKTRKEFAKQVGL